jgi:hypothetical protein
LQKAVATPGTGWPSTSNLDGYTPSHRAVRLLGQEDARWQSVTVRNSRYLNNIVEQDHRAIKRRCASMLGFKTARTAAVTLSGIEQAHRIRKQQFLLDQAEQGRPAGNRSLKQLWDQALTAEPVPAGCASHLPPSMHRNPTAGRAPLPHVRSDTRRRYPRKVFSGGGLYMYLTPCGGKYWRYKYLRGEGEDAFAGRLS